MYEVVWLRLAMAAFGVTTPLVSTVLSIFMAGLALGSVGGGWLAQRIATRPGAPLRAYALAELVIGAGSLLVPIALAGGRAVLLAGESRVAWDSGAYHFASAVCVAAALLPFCVAMGATFPLALAAIRQERAPASPRAFSHLYLANVIGATAGTLATALVLVEILGFRTTLFVAGALNALLAAAAMALSVRPVRLDLRTAVARLAPDLRDPGPVAGTAGRPPMALLAGLALTGLTSLAMEVVWLRQVAPYLGTEVYTFAIVLATYLVATSVGSRLYRAFTPAAAARLAAVTWIVLPALALLPLATTDPRLPLGAVARLALGIVPFCIAVSVLTPMLVDRWSMGAPGRAGAAYAVNVSGAIVGPLLAGFVLLPALGERGALVVLALPTFVAAALVAAWPSRPGRDRALSSAPLRGTLFAGTVAVGLALVTLFTGWESSVATRQVRHDHTATVVAAGSGRAKSLWINGHGGTTLTNMTKWMAHLPLAHLEHVPRNAVVICFGMGTSFRSALTWGIPVTAVDLVPSVPRFFGFYHADAAAILGGGFGRVVIDDGRRFLERSPGRWDVIVVDPPPPTAAAGSSLLYSREFYEVIRRRLGPSGIVQQWVPTSEPSTMVSVARTLGDVFPEVRVFPGINPQTLDIVGVHFLAGQGPLANVTGATLARRLPEAARRDLLEWSPGMTATGVFDWILKRETSVAAFVRAAPTTPSISDDRPFNEYYFLRRWLGWPR